MKRILLASCIALICSNSALAKTVAGVELAPQTTINATALDYQGSGIRKKFFMKLYVASLFGSNDVAAITSGTQGAVIQLDIISGLITSEKMAASMEDGFAQSAGDELETLRPQIDKFTAAFSAPVTEGDSFQVVSLPQQPVQLRKNGEVLVEINHADFRRVLLGIWLGDNPLDDDLKEDMLGV